MRLTRLSIVTTLVACVGGAYRNVCKILHENLLAAVDRGSSETTRREADDERRIDIDEGLLCMTVEHFHVADVSNRFWECATLSDRELRQL